MWGNKKPDTPQAAQPEPRESNNQSVAEACSGVLGGKTRDEYRFDASIEVQLRTAPARVSDPACT